MKRKLISLMFCTLLCISIVFLVSCGKDECEHNWANEVIKTEATCQSEGEAEYTCTKCKKTKTIGIEKIDHKKSSDFKYDAESHFLYCTVCDVHLEKEPHTMVDDKITIPATAYESGIMITKCSSCTYTSTRQIDSIPHEKDSEKSFNEEYHWYKCISHEDCSVVIQKVKHTLLEGEILKEPSEEEDGLQRIFCENCDYEKHVVLPSFKHIKGELTHDGTSHWYTCSKHENCGVEYEKAAHDWIEVAREEATCTEKGSISYKCSVCEATKTEEIQAHHSLENYPEKKPSCVDEGWNAYVACTKCDYTTKETINALGHSYTLVHTDPSGHYQGCIRCYEKTSEVIEHTYTIWKTTTPTTLYANGIETKSCECGYIGIETREIEAQANFKNAFSLDDSNGLWKYGSIEYDWNTEAFHFIPLMNQTEAKDGWTGEGIEIKAGWINANQMLGIAYMLEEDINVNTSIRFIGSTDATRLDLRVGIKNNDELYMPPKFYNSNTNTLEVSFCSSLKAGDIIYFMFSNGAFHVEDAYPNGSLDIIMKPVTLKEGYGSDESFHWKCCNIHEACDVKFNLEAHTWEVFSDERTCIEGGKIIYKCSICGKTKEENGSAKGHNYSKEWTIDVVPTCTEVGSKSYHCLSCDDRIDITTIPANGHTYGAWETKQEPTETNPGIKERECGVCHHKETQTIPVLGHTHSYSNEWSIDVAPTCTEAGSKSHHCLSCDDRIDITTIPANGHTYGDLIEKVDKTCTTSGKEAYYKCSVCNKYFNKDKEEVTESSLIILAGHNLENHPAKESTCTEAGWDAYVACTNCDYTTKEEIDALQHDYSAWKITRPTTLYVNGVETLFCSRCGEQGLETKELEAEANFRNDFSIEDSNGLWKYGSIDYKWSEENFDFIPLTNKTESNDGWMGEGIEIKAGWIKANQMMGIAYTISEDIHAGVRIRFVGGTDLTRLALRVGVKNNEGILYSNPSFHGSDTNTLEVSLEFDFKAGDTIYFIFSNETSVEGAHPNGELSINLKKCVEFRNDFSIEDSNGLWKYGSVDYKWSEENFDFIPLTNKTESNDGWMGEGIEIKAGWIKANQMMGIAYTISEDIHAGVRIRFVGGTDLTRLALRVGVKNNEGMLYSNPSFHSSDTNTLEVSLEFDFKAGDTIYFIFSNETSVEGAHPNGNLDITIF